MATKLLIATGNRGKLKEIMEVLQYLPNLEFISLADLNLENTVEENGPSYEANSFLKAQHFFKATGFLTLAEDSGIEVEALKGELGVKTRRWGAGERASDQEWLEFFLRRMVREENRRAKFVCVATLMWGEAPEQFVQFRGETWGTILSTPQVEIPHGIPISAVFLPDGAKKVYAALSSHEKNQISHRGKAMHTLKDFLRKQSF